MPEGVKIQPQPAATKRSEGGILQMNFVVVGSQSLPAEQSFRYARSRVQNGKT
jgi:hypothetical protein